jgi:hypothetical protein
MVEELAAIVRVDLQDREGETGAEAEEGIPHHKVAASQISPSLTLAGSDIDHLHSADVLTGGRQATVVNRVDFEVSWLLFVPWDAPHGNVASGAVGGAWTSAGQTRLILADAAGDAPHGRRADAFQL